MESASLRIKFTPLLQESLKNDSKCCLEIVPEVTYIQNFEKIEWKENTDFIEYIIPMTYKVILKKRQRVNETSHDLEKVYYSCVDLASHSSVNTNVGRTDATKMISDTFILGKFTANLKNETIPTENSKLKSITNFKDPIQNGRSECSDAPAHSSNDILLVTNNTEQKDHITKINVDASTSQDYITDLNVVDNHSVDKAVSSEIARILSAAVSKLQLSKDTQIESNETVNETSAESSKDCSLRKLSLTPICSINTNEKLISKNFQFLTCDHVVCRMFEPRKVITGATKIKDISVKRHIEELLDKNIEVFDSDSVEIPRFKERLRERPEITVAKFMKKMETEIMPLKIMLHDIFQKCSSLGLTKSNNGKYYLNSFMLKNDPKNNNQVLKCCKIENQTKCNRVVYSIVFDS